MDAHTGALSGVKMKKSIIFTFLFLCFPVFSQTKGIIIGDNVRIRKAPSLNSEIIEKKT